MSSDPASWVGPFAASVIEELNCLHYYGYYYGEYYGDPIYGSVANCADNWGYNVEGYGEFLTGCVSSVSKFYTLIY